MKHYRFIVIGAGAGGLVVAIGLARAGKKVLLIDKGTWGGDCTNFGCIPSKTLLASAEYAHALRNGREFGLDYTPPPFGANGALDRVRETVEGIRSHEDPKALNAAGVETLQGEAHFTSPHTLQVGSEEVHGEKIVIATGSHPFIPPIEGLKETPYLTNETVFELKEIPNRLGVLGAGPIGCELAQAFSRLGSKVSLIESMRGIMPVEDEAVDPVIRSCFEKEGLDVYVHCDANRISYENGHFYICTTQEGKDVSVEVDQLLIATGRRPNLSHLNLDKAGVKHTERAVPVDAYGRTNQKHIFVIGDAVGGPQFTHLAEYQGRAVLTSLLIPGPFNKKIGSQALPRCTFTSPEVASIGMTEKEALKKYGASKLATYTLPLKGIDRAITSQTEEGFVKVVTKKWSSKILGAVIVAPRAGEMLLEISTAMKHSVPLRKLAGLIHPYPTLSGAVRNCADLWLKQTVLSLLGKKK